MTYIITEPCVGVKDAACVDVCPVDCIYTRDEDDMFYISPDECIDCAACEPVCPVMAIFTEDATPPQCPTYVVSEQFNLLVKCPMQLLQRAKWPTAQGNDD